jgi:predicted nucleic acid-binding protein
LKYLLDTNVVSELRKVGDGKADANVTRWVSAQDARDLFISAITILEIERGILSLQRVTGPRELSCGNGRMTVSALNLRAVFFPSMMQ